MSVQGWWFLVEGSGFRRALTGFMIRCELQAVRFGLIKHRGLNVFTLNSEAYSKSGTGQLTLSENKKCFRESLFRRPHAEDPTASGPLVLGHFRGAVANN